MNLRSVTAASARAERAAVRKLLLNYRTALDEIRGLIANAYSRYGGDWKTMQQYSRLTNLEKAITAEIGKLTGKNAVGLKAGISDVYQTTFYRTAFATEKAVGANLGFGVLPTKTIAAAVNNPLDRVGFLQRNRTNQAALTRQLQEQLTQGLIRGESYEQVARRIKKRMDVGATNVQRIANTEMHRVQTIGRLDAFAEAADAGVEFEYIWDATLDDVTREDHQDMDGEHAEVDSDGNPVFTLPTGDQTEGPGLSGDPAQDINCRCTVRAEIKGYGPEVRMAREKEGQRGEIRGYTTYKEWEKERL